MRIFTKNRKRLYKLGSAALRNTLILALTFTLVTLGLIGSNPQKTYASEATFNPVSVDRDYFFEPQALRVDPKGATLESALITIEFLYEDGPEILLPDGLGFYTSVGQIRAEHIGFEGIRLLNPTYATYLAKDTTLERKDIVYQATQISFSDLVARTTYPGGYRDSDDAPLLRGSWPDYHPTMLANHIYYYYSSNRKNLYWNNYMNAKATRCPTWFNSAVTQEVAREGLQPARYSFLSIDQCGSTNKTTAEAGAHDKTGTMLSDFLGLIAALVGIALATAGYGWWRLRQEKKHQNFTKWR